MGDQGVDKGAVGITGRRVDDEPGGLVDHDDLIVLMQDAEGNRLPLRGRVERRWHDQVDRLPRFDAI